MGKPLVSIPDKVSVEVNKNSVKVKGPKGELSRSFSPDISIKKEGNDLVFSRPSEQSHHKSLHGLTRALVNNMVIGVSDGFSKDLTIEGVGYRAQLQGKDLVLSLGYSHPIIFEGNDQISYEVDRTGPLTKSNGH